MTKKYIIFLFIFSACQQNLFENASSVGADDKYYNDALAALNAESYEESISIVTTKISAPAQAATKVRELLASAYAGRCGLNFIDYTDKLSQQSSGSALQIVMFPFIQRAADPASCRSAVETMELIGPTENRTANQNTFVSIVGMVLLGSALRDSADLSPSLGDGTADVDICTAITDAQIDNMILGFGFFNKNFAYVNSHLIGNYSGSSLSSVGSTCTTQLGAATCETTDASLITPTMRNSFRDLVNTSDYGIGSYSTGGNPMQIPNACP